jgi:hypothetical protein
VWEDVDGRYASFDKLRMRKSLCATKILPHPELVEELTAAHAIFGANHGTLKAPRRLWHQA